MDEYVPGGCFRCGYGEPCGSCDLEYEASQDPMNPLHERGTAESGAQESGN